MKPFEAIYTSPYPTYKYKLLNSQSINKYQYMLQLVDKKYLSNTST